MSTIYGVIIDQNQKMVNGISYKERVEAFPNVSIMNSKIEGVLRGKKHTAIPLFTSKGTILNMLLFTIPKSVEIYALDDDAESLNYEEMMNLIKQ